MTTRREGEAANEYEALNDSSPRSGNTNDASYTGGSREGPVSAQKNEDPFQDPSPLGYSSYEQFVQRYSGYPDEDELPDETSAWRVEDDDISYW